MVPKEICGHEFSSTVLVALLFSAAWHAIATCILCFSLPLSLSPHFFFLSIIISDSPSLYYSHIQVLFLLNSLQFKFFNDYPIKNS